MNPLHLLWILPLSLLALLCLLLHLRAHVRIAYAPLTLWAGVGALRVRILPRKPMQKQQLTKAKRPAKSRAQKSGKSTPVRLELADWLELLRRLQDSGRPRLRKLRFERLTLHVVCAVPEDPALAAMAYGGCAAAISALLPALEAVTTIRRCDISVDVDFEGKAAFSCDIETSGQILRMARLVLWLYRQFRVVQRRRSAQTDPASISKTTSSENNEGGQNHGESQ